MNVLLFLIRSSSRYLSGGEVRAEALQRAGRGGHGSLLRDVLLLQDDILIRTFHPVLHVDGHVDGHLVTLVRCFGFILTRRER